MRAENGAGILVRFLGAGEPPPPGRHLVRLTGAALFLFPFSLVFLAGGLLPPGFGWTSTVTILLYSAVLFASEVRAVPVRRAAETAALIGILFFLVEWVGVTTGVPFGAYVYTGVLTPLVAGVPIAIAGAWYCTLISTTAVARRLAGPAARFRTALTAALLTLAFDIVLEPFATAVNGYWLWEGGSVPLTNYAAWFGLSFAAVWRMTGADTGEVTALRFRTSVLIYALQFVLFTVIIFLHGHVIEIGAALAVLALARAAATLPARRSAA